MKSLPACYSKEAPHKQATLEAFEDKSPSKKPQNLEVRVFALNATKLIYP